MTEKNTLSISKNPITEGVIWKEFLKFFFPILIGTFFQQMYNTVDTLVVGRFCADGETAIACVGGSSAQIVNLVVGFFVGLTGGFSVIIAQFFGAKDNKHVELALHTAYAFSVVGGVVLGLVCILFTPKILHFMSTPDKLMRGSSLYMRIYFAGLIFVFIYNMGGSILRALGDSKRPLYYLIFCTLVNIFLDVLFVAVFHLDVAGVAIATLLAQACSSILVTRALMYQIPGIHLDLKKLKIHREMFWRMFRIGLPSGIQSSMYSIANITVQSSVNRLGVASVTAWSVVDKVASLFWMFTASIGVTVTTFAGQNFGAGKIGRLQKSVIHALLMDMMAGVFFFLLFFNLSAPLFSVFTSNPEVIRLGTIIIDIMSAGFFLFSFIEVFSAALRAEGYVLIPTLISVGGICLFRIVWLTVFHLNGSLNEIARCYPFSWLVSASLITTYYLIKQPEIRRYFQKKPEENTES